MWRSSGGKMRIDAPSASIISSPADKENNPPRSFEKRGDGYPDAPSNWNCAIWESQSPERSCDVAAKSLVSPP
jgi:hypothetical protein